MDGFLGTRASWLLDALFLAMFVVVPLLFTSVWIARARRNYRLHRTIMVTLSVVLAVAVIAFELHVQSVGWMHRAEASPYFSEPWPQSGVGISLIVHLVCAIATTPLWIVVLVRALRSFGREPAPGTHSASHRRWAWLATWGLTATAVTACIFYAIAFVAE